MNAFEIPSLRFSLVAGEDIAQRRFVSVNSSGEGVLASAGGNAIGASMNQPEDGQILEIADGIVMVEAGGSVAAGAAVQSDADGKAVTQSSGIALGVAITGGSSSNIIAVKMLCIGSVDGAAGSDGDSILLVSYSGADLEAGADLSATPLYTVPAGYTVDIIGASVISGGVAAGVDDSNTSVFALALTDTTALAGVTFDATTAFPASGAAQAMSLESAAAGLVAGNVINLAVTNGATANLPAFTVQLNLKISAAA